MYCGVGKCYWQASSSYQLTLIAPAISATRRTEWNVSPMNLIGESPMINNTVSFGNEVWCPKFRTIPLMRNWLSPHVCSPHQSLMRNCSSSCRLCSPLQGDRVWGPCGSGSMLLFHLFCCSITNLCFFSTGRNNSMHVGDGRWLGGLCNPTDL